MEEDKDIAKGIVKSKLNPKYNFDLNELKGRIDPYSQEGIDKLTEEKRLELQHLWCMATRAVPVPPKR
jgi:hypothetical protein